MKMPIINSLCCSTPLLKTSPGTRTLGIPYGDRVGGANLFRDLSTELFTLATQDLTFALEAWTSAAKGLVTSGIKRFPHFLLGKVSI